jgi:hypothetical protein
MDVPQSSFLAHPAIRSGAVNAIHLHPTPPPAIPSNSERVPSFEGHPKFTVHRPQFIQ